MSTKSRPSSARQKTSGAQKSAAKQAKPVRSLAELVDVIHDDVLHKLVNEENTSKRKDIAAQIAKHLNNLNIATRARLLAKDQRRRELYKRLGESCPSQTFTGDFLTSACIDAWIKHESEADSAIYNAIDKYIRSQDVERQQLHEVLDRRQNVEDKLFPSKPNPPNGPVSQVGNSNADRIAMLEGLIKKQDADISVLQHQIEDQSTKYVFLPKDDYVQMSQRLHPYGTFKRQGSRDVKVPSRQNSKNGLADGLRDDVINVIDQVERLRSRVQQTSDTIVDQQKDKKVSLQILHAENQSAAELREVIVRKVNEWEEERDEMEVEIRSLRLNMESLATQNRSLMESLNKEQEDKELRAKEARARRQSMPTAATAEEGIKKAAEKRQRRATVISSGMPRINAVQLSLDGPPVMSARQQRARSSVGGSAHNGHGPMRAGTRYS